MGHVLAPLLHQGTTLVLLVLLGVAFVETGVLVGFLVPGDTLLFVAGTLIGTGVLHLEVWPTFLAVVVAAVAGNQVAYLLGRRYGVRLLERRTRRGAVRARLIVDRYGAGAVVVARFVPLVRTIVPLLAGTGRMRRRRFLVVNVVGAIAWAAATIGLGAWFGTVPWVARHQALLLLGVALFSLVFSVLPALVAVRRGRLTSAS